jgi:hypothetical protein
MRPGLPKPPHAANDNYLPPYRLQSSKWPEAIKVRGGRTLVILFSGTIYFAIVYGIWRSW